jgi:uncharacterized protein YpuA (DUF1002 family)
MGPFEMVVAIVLIVTVAAIVKSKHKHQGAANDESVLALREQISRLEQRVQTLEKLATDPAKRLADEIESLRGS